MSKYTYGLFTKSDGPIIHIPTGLTLAPHINQEFEPSASTMDDLMAVTEIYVAHLQRLVAHPDYMVNTRAVASDFKHLYDGSPAPQPAYDDVDEFFDGEDDRYPDGDAQPDAADPVTPPAVPRGAPMSDEAIRMVLGVHQANLDKDAKKAGQTAVAVHGVRTLLSGKGTQGLTFLDEHGEVVFEKGFWDNSEGDKEKKWMNPYSKFPNRDIGTTLWESESQSRFGFSKPMFVAVKKNGEFTNLMSVFPWDGTLIPM